MSLIVIAQNITGPDTLVRPDGTSDYDVEVSINRRNFIWCGKIENHKRDDGAQVLLRRIADQIDKHQGIQHDTFFQAILEAERGQAKAEGHIRSNRETTRSRNRIQTRRNKKARG